MNEIEREVKATIKGIIDKRVKGMKAGEPNTDDLLGILLESNFKEIEQHGNKNFGTTIEEVIEESTTSVWIAGQEATSVWIVWTMILLGRHPDWQVRAREEVLQVFGDGMPEFDGLNRLKVTMILHKSLRLYSSASALRRTITTKTKLGELTLPAGVILYLPTILVYHVKEIWGEDAIEFKPERFSKCISTATKGQMAVFPFGAGSRICIGLNFAMIEAKMAMAMILQHFAFELSPLYTHAPQSVITMQP
uniref:Cytochrome P450 n=1 Tax=Solanum lycopersicum TaxID=4081 RepID=A0A3Q7HBF1_SOLLC